MNRSGTVSREPARVMILVCGCGQTLDGLVDRDRLAARLTADPEVCGVAFPDRVCTQNGWENMAGKSWAERASTGWWSGPVCLSATINISVNCPD